MYYITIYVRLSTYTQSYLMRWRYCIAILGKSGTELCYMCINDFIIWKYLDWRDDTLKTNKIWY